MLPDTLGILTPDEVTDFIGQIIPKYPGIHFDFHGHNDYDLGTANVLEAVKSGVQGIHLTVNGMGERAGNAPLASAVAVLHDFLPKVKTGVVEKSLYQVSRLVETFSGFRIPDNKPIVGENVIYTDGRNPCGWRQEKQPLPQRPDARAFCTTSANMHSAKQVCKSNIENNLAQLGIELSDAVPEEGYAKDY